MQVSWGHTCIFRIVPPANTLMRWVNEKRLRPHSAGSTLPHLWPTCSSSGWPPLITARYFSSNPSDSGSLRTPCPPRNHEKDGFRFVLAVSGFRLLARLDFSIPSFLSTASEALPPLLDTSPLLRAPTELHPP